MRSQILSEAARLLRSYRSAVRDYYEKREVELQGKKPTGSDFLCTRAPVTAALPRDWDESKLFGRNVKFYCVLL
jgi:hypothetical protein